jgi:hypothetical protein
VAFDPVRGTVEDNGFAAHVDLTDAQRRGLRIEADTVMWWLRQSEAARGATFSGADARVDLDQALAMFNAYWNSCAGDNAWSHGAGFDLVLMESAYFVCGLKAPWRYTAARDTRTIYAIAGINPKDYFGSGETAHSAVDDARAQARAVIAAYAKLGLAAPVAETAAA